MSSAITTAGQTRINQLRGAELPLIIDRMVLALIPGLDPTLAVDRSQQMPDPGDIVHTAIIAPDHKGYVNPDQVVYSIILGSDVGDFSFNWIGLVEAATDTVIAITTTPETPKRKTNLGNNTTGNNITRNFMIAFQDAQNLTGVTVAAETWQFDYQAELTGHTELVIDPEQEGVEKKHVTNSQAKVWQDHTEMYHAFETPAGTIIYFAGQVAPAGHLKANGAAVPIVSYASLASAIYVGDASNATAAWGYRCTDTGNPTSTRDIAGTYIVLPDLRAEFVRGVDDGRGIDSGRVFGSSQLDAFKSHKHTGSALTGHLFNAGSQYTAYDQFGGDTGSTGGTETRPRNIALLACIKY